MVHRLHRSFRLFLLASDMARLLRRRDCREVDDGLDHGEVVDRLVLSGDGRRGICDGVCWTRGEGERREERRQLEG